MIFFERSAKAKMSKNRMFKLNLQGEDVKCLKACFDDPHGC